MSTGKKKILIVEDESDLVTILQILLSHSNFEVFSASDGDAGLSLANTVLPDIILLDIMMPGKDGFTLLRELKSNEETCDIPIIMVTARDRMGESCQLEGADSFIVKPFEYKDLEKNITELLSKVE